VEEFYKHATGFYGAATFDFPAGKIADARAANATLLTFSGRAVAR